MNGKRVVLVLEDLPSWQDTVRLLLEAERDENGEEIYETVPANSLASAMTLLHSRVFDVAIVDICLVEGDLTNTDGMKFLDELEKYYVDDRTHAIMLSGHGTISLAVDAVKRSYVVHYFEKDPGRFDEDRFVSEVAHAWRLTQNRRAERDRTRVRLLPPSFFRAIDISRLVTSLTPEVDSVAAGKDLELLLENLLPNVWPLTQEVQATVESGASAAESLAHILTWSRKLVKTLDVAIGRTGTLDSLQPLARQHETDVTEKLFHWSTQYFDGVVFGLPDIRFEEFLSVVA
jgi:ActR/RegA family two-component response regulator